MIDLSGKFAHYRARMIAAMKARRLTGEMLAERIEAHPVTISKLKSGRMNLTDEWRARVAVGINVSEDILFGDGPLPPPLPFEIHQPKRRGGQKATLSGRQMLPHYGLAAGSLFGAHTADSSQPGEVPCPPGLVGVVGAYALSTMGDSMVPRFFPRERLYINPNQAIRPADFVVIQVDTDGGTGTETWVKRFDAEDSVWIWVSQYNPPLRMDFKKKYVRYMHRVVPINELF